MKNLRCYICKTFIHGFINGATVLANTYKVKNKDLCSRCVVILYTVYFGDRNNKTFVKMVEKLEGLN